MTKLLSLPVRLLDDLGFSSGLASSLEGCGMLFAVCTVVSEVAMLDETEVLSPRLPAVPLASATEAVSGVGAAVTAGVAVTVFETSALTRMRNAWSKTSCVRIA